jgi:hypothetical protein
VSSRDSNEPEDLVQIDRRRFDEALERLHDLLPIDDPNSPLWDLWLELVELGRSR